MLDLVGGRVPLVIELKGVPGHDAGLVAKVGAELQELHGKAAIMSFDHWLVRDFPRDAPGIPAGLTAWGEQQRSRSRRISRCWRNGISLRLLRVTRSANPFVSFVRERLDMPVISWTIRDKPAVERSLAHADQMTFEGFDPDRGLTS